MDGFAGDHAGHRMAHIHAVGIHNPRHGLRVGIHVLRMDDQLMVKRVIRGPGGALSILSDNPTWPNWENVKAKDVQIIGRVVWAGRRL